MAQHTLSTGAVDAVWGGATPPVPVVLQCVGAPGSQEALMPSVPWFSRPFTRFAVNVKAGESGAT